MVAAIRTETVFDPFPLASLPITNARLSALAYVADGPATAPEIGTAIGRARNQAWRVLTALEQEGLVASVRQFWEITPKGLSALRALAVELDGIISRSKPRQALRERYGARPSA